MKALVAGLFAVAGLALAPSALAANLLPNPSFEGSTANWAGWNSTISLASDGTSGPGAAKVNGKSTYYSIMTSPRPVATHPAGVTYTAGGAVRSDVPGRSICLYIREWSGSSQVGTAHSCVTVTMSWQRFSTVSYTSKGGSSLEEYVLATGASGESFEIDDMSLDDSSTPPDTTPPDTTITSGPADGSSTTSTTATFSFTSTENGTFQCELDTAGWTTCSSPQGYGGLGAGSHTFSVRAIDAAGNVDQTPATRTWSVGSSDTTPPDTTITAGPAGGSSTTATSASFSFSSTETGTFQCALDGASFSSCTSPKSYASLGVGSHSFSVRAIDAAGNVDPTPASRSWTITATDTTPPDTTITAGPADGSSTTATSASFSFSSTETGTFQCALDGAPWSSCASPQTYASLATGSHTFAVRAIDAAGNVDPTPASWGWSIVAQPSGSDPTMLFVGDTHCADSVPGAFSAVAQLIGSLDPDGNDPIGLLGDESGDQGTANEFADCFDPIWGSLKARTHPALGNHDWQSGNADAYFSYWGSAAGPVNEGWYSYDVGTWHVVVLSSYCGPVGGCGMGSPQVAWLKSDLAAHTNQCTLAYWHHPYFTSSPQPGTSGNTAAFWTVLMSYHADVIVNAHVHLYERFAPQDASGNATASGIREFVVGTGGGQMVGWSTRAANSEVIQNSSFGVLSLTLHDGSYDWQFSPATGSFTDSGTGSCH